MRITDKEIYLMSYEAPESEASARVANGKKAVALRSAWETLVLLRSQIDAIRFFPSKKSTLSLIDQEKDLIAEALKID